VVEPVRNDANAHAVDAEVPCDAVPDELARDDDASRGARSAVVVEGPERALRAREELRQVEVLQVVHRHDRRRVERRHADRERIVDDVG
jgi:hypothetical protein